MPKKGYTEEEILRALGEVEVEETGVAVCRKLGISEQTLYAWKKKYAGLGLSELRQLREENAKRKRLVTDLSLTGTSSRGSSQKGAEGSRPAHPGGGAPCPPPGERAPGDEVAQGPPLHDPVSPPPAPKCRGARRGNIVSGAGRKNERLI